MQIPFLIAYQSFSGMKEFCKVMYQTQPLGFYLAQKKGKINLKIIFHELLPVKGDLKKHWDYINAVKQMTSMNIEE